MRILLYLIVILSLAACGHGPAKSNMDPSLTYPGEKRFKNLRQLTSGGTNAEAYWSFDGKWLSFQHKGTGMHKYIDSESERGPECDQIYLMNSSGTKFLPISINKGRTTCSFFYPDNKRVLFSSTKSTGDNCPPTPDMSKGYVWPIYNSYQIYSTKSDGTDLQPLEPGAPRAYNAEATICHDGSVIFTSDRDGDLELYTGKLDSLGTLTGIKRITHAMGYDGGAFFSHDCKQIVWRASRPRQGKEMDDYKALLSQHLVRPGELEIWIANSDGTHARQVTRLRAASFAPSFTQDGKKILFSSNPRDPNGHKFDLYMINVNGTGLERVSFSDTFDSFPMFSPDGRFLAFSSNRNGTAPRETNVFIAEWVNTSPDDSNNISTEDQDPANRFLALIQELSAPELEGRGLFTSGRTKAEVLLAQRFQAIGLKPFFDVFKKAAKYGSGFMHNIEIRVPTTNNIGKANNVAGVFGNGCGKTQPVVIGAHLDALGLGAENSLEPTRTGLHPGADDNASGIAALLEAARIIGNKNDLRQSCFVFMGFAGEEVGTAGSSRFVEMLQNAQIKPKAMLNMDMVGRMDNNTLIVFGTASAKEWKKIVEDSCTDYRLNCPGGGDGYGPSDQMAFYMMGIPVLHFFTGPHEDYHRTTDTPDKINATGGVQVSEVVASIALKSADPQQKFNLQKVSTPVLFGRQIFEKKRAPSGAYLGTIPDYASLTAVTATNEKTTSANSAADHGVKIAGTRPGSPAEKAGLIRGDILFGITAPVKPKLVPYN
ncbi:MAG: M20/M25/M40 family metallo-hydrolase, partial [Bdellovibrionota bacterium]